MKIAIITSGQPSANPRVVKEAKALAGAGFQVSVIYNLLSPWADEYDRILFNLHPEIQWIVAGKGGKKGLPYKFTRLRRKAYEMLWNTWPKNSNYALRSHVLYSQELAEKASSIQADLYIAHNIGALPVALQIARKHRAKAGFDAEDFHRGEDVKDSLHWRRIPVIEDDAIPALDYISAASPAILERYRELYQPAVSFYIPNVVEQLPDTPVQKQHGGITRLFWFSQVVGRQRGLENAIKAIALVKREDIALHLVGNVDAEMKTYLQDLWEEGQLQKNMLHFDGVVAPDELVQYASRFDIGLAMESNWCESRDLCETNKLFVYLAGALAMLLSDTLGQQQFLTNQPGVGLLYQQDDPQSLAKGILTYMEQPGLLKQHQEKSLRLAREQLNWEHQGQLFIQKIKEVSGKPV